MQVKASHKNNDRARSIDVTRDEDNLSDTDAVGDKAEEPSQDQLAAVKSAWALGGDYRAHVVQNIIYCGSQLGVYKLVPVPGRDGVQEKVFFRGLYAADEVDALRRCLLFILLSV